MTEKFSLADLEAAREEWLDAREIHGPEDERTVAARDYYRHVVQSRIEAAEAAEDGGQL